MFHKLLVDHCICTRHIGKCLFNVDNNRVITYRFPDGKCDNLTVYTKNSTFEMQLLKQSQRIERYTHLAVFLFIFVTSVFVSPFQSHLKAFFQIVLCERLICPVLIRGLELIDVVPFTVKLFPRQGTKLFRLINIIRRIPVIFNLVLSRIPAVDKGKLCLGKSVHMKLSSLLLAVFLHLRDQFPDFLIRSCGPCKTVPALCLFPEQNSFSCKGKIQIIMSSPKHNSKKCSVTAS